MRIKNMVAAGKEKNVVDNAFRAADHLLVDAILAAMRDDQIDTSDLAWYFITGYIQDRMPQSAELIRRFVECDLL
jgi:hypothetical protein